MIASLEGTVTQLLEDSIVLSVSGVGFRIFVPRQVCQETEVFQSKTLFTHLVVREDALTLFGFDTIEERDLYVMLLGANGVGPRTALAVISTMSPGLIRKAVLSNESDLFTRVPGIGKKTAQSLVLHLSGRFKGEYVETPSGDRELDADVIAALTGLGYSIIEAQAAIQTLPKDAPKDLEGRLRSALQYFSN
jgi:holliday junction DNA helicase RuvA